MEKLKIQDSHFVDLTILRLLNFLIASYCKTEHSAAFKLLLFFFYLKWRNMTSLKRHFLKFFSTDFSEILAADVKLMLWKVLKVLRRYLLPFLSYRENPAGGDIRPPPQRGAGLTGS